MKDFDAEKRTVEENRKEIQNELEERKKHLKLLFAQKLKDLSNAFGNEELVNETYNSLQQDILSQIHGLELILKKLEGTSLENSDVKAKLQNALQVVDQIIEKGVLNRKDIEILIERIEVDEMGLPEIELKYGLSGLIQYSPAQEMNRRENEIIYKTMQLILEDDRGFTSAKYLSKALTDTGYSKSKKNVLPYIGLMLEMGIVEQSENSLKPYTIVKSKAEIQEIMAKFYRENLSAENSGTITQYDSNLHDYTVNRWYASDGL